MRPYLDVERSLTGRRWRDRLDEAGRAQALAMVQAHGFDDLVARVLVGRGVSADGAPAFLDPKLRDLLPDPLSLVDMGPAVARLGDAVMRRETVAVFGDYDVDGASSAALLAGFLRDCDVPVKIHIPDRLIEGYGPHDEAIRGLAAAGATLLVTVDCGTTSHGPLALARSLGLDVIVLDHHQAPEDLPATTALVNPNRLDDLSGLGMLCAAGVVFMTLVALNRELRQRGYWKGRPEADLFAALDLVALGTVADVVPLTGLNRAFVRQGLAVMKARGRLGLRALSDVARLGGPPRPYHLGFLLGPRINAGGRIGDAGLGARLLLETDAVEAQRIAETLDRLNGERQAIEQTMVAEAEAQALATLGIDGEGADPVLVVADAAWHLGVLGLVAARLKERFQRPVVALGRDGQGRWTGSARSIPGVDLGRAVHRAVADGLALKGGGHAMAAGVTLAEDGIPAFRERLSASLSDAVTASRADRALAIDGAITAAGARPELIARLEAAGPFGSAHPEPLIVLPSHRLVEASEVGRGHLRLGLRAGDGSVLQGIAFRAIGQPLGQGLLAARGETVHVAGHLAVDHYQNRERVQLRVVDAAVPGGRGRAAP